VCVCVRACVRACGWCVCVCVCTESLRAFVQMKAFEAIVLQEGDNLPMVSVFVLLY
jgi:hypothetical protein